MAEARIRNEDWVEDEQLVADIRKYVMQNMKREEALDFLRRDYPQYAWSLPTLSRRMRHFGIKYVNYNTDLEEVRQAIQTKLDGPGKLLGYRTMQRKVRENHGLAVPHRDQPRRPTTKRWCWPNSKKQKRKNWNVHFLGK